jgi:hypothetical protein
VREECQDLGADASVISRGSDSHQRDIGHVQTHNGFHTPPVVLRGAPVLLVVVIQEDKRAEQWDPAVAGLWHRRQVVHDGIDTRCLVRCDSILPELFGQLNNVFCHIGAARSIGIDVLLDPLAQDGARDAPGSTDAVLSFLGDCLEGVLVDRLVERVDLTHDRILPLGQQGLEVIPHVLG